MKLKKEIEALKKSNISEIVYSRIKEFREKYDKSDKEWFDELCFCILTANSSAKKGIEIQKYMEKVNGFQELDEKELKKILRGLGHRFYNKRAEFIVQARRFSNNIKKTINSFDNEFQAREWLVKNIKGIGYKEASHFLRNVGFDDLAILDRHVLSVLAENKIIEKSTKQLTKKKYLEIEHKMKKLSKDTDLKFSELDLFLWYMKTGKVLK